MKIFIKALIIFLCIINNSANAKVHRIFVWDGYYQFQNDEFDIKIYIGDTIQWYSISNALRAHTITSVKIPVGAKSFDYPVPIANMEFNYVVEKAGIYEYVCTPHAPGMKGSFEVESPNGVEADIQYQIIETGPIIQPNPVTDKMKIAQLTPDIRYKLTVYDDMGKSIYTASIHNCEFVEVDIANFNAGTYTAHLAYCGCKPQKNGCGGAGKTLKFIKQ